MELYQASRSLRSLVGRLDATAGKVSASSEHLAKTSAQAAQASQEITKAMEQVAAGASAQDRNAASASTAPPCGSLSVSKGVTSKIIFVMI